MNVMLALYTHTMLSILTLNTLLQHCKYSSNISNAVTSHMSNSFTGDSKNSNLPKQHRPANYSLSVSIVPASHWSRHGRWREKKSNQYWVRKRRLKWRDLVRGWECERQKGQNGVIQRAEIGSSWGSKERMQFIGRWGEMTWKGTEMREEDRHVWWR